MKKIKQKTPTIKDTNDSVVLIIAFLGTNLGALLIIALNSQLEPQINLDGYGTILIMADMFYLVFLYIRVSIWGWPRAQHYSGWVKSFKRGFLEKWNKK